jgi:hypothetical protein
MAEIEPCLRLQFPDGGGSSTHRRASARLPADVVGNGRRISRRSSQAASEWSPQTIAVPGISAARLDGVALREVVSCRVLCGAGSGFECESHPLCLAVRGEAAPADRAVT